MRLRVVLFSLIVFVFSVSSVSAGELKAGVAVVNITPPVGSPHCFVQSNGKPLRLNRGIHDDLFAKVLVLYDGEKTLTIVSIDLVGFVPERVRQLLPPAFRNTLFCASHNHLGSAVISFTPPQFVYRTPYLSGVEEEIADAVIKAHSNIVPVKIGVGKGTVDISYNKLGGGKGLYLCGHNNPERIRFEPVDQEVGVIRVDDLEGKPLAILVNYASHPVVVWISEFVSAGYPGYMSRFVEEAVGGNAVCFFIQGACGDTQPYEACSSTWDKAEHVGRKLADCVLSVNGRIETISFPEAKIAFKTDIIPMEGIKEAKGMTLNAELNTAVINNQIAFVSGPGEFFVDFQLDLKKRSPIEHTFFFGYTNGYLGYFPTRKAWEEDWNKWFNHNMWVGVGAGEKIIDKALENIRELLSK